METRICHRCSTEVGKREFCPTCVEEVENARDVATMTPEERLAEFDSWNGALEIPFDLMFPRLGQLVGRPIFLHEFGGDGFEYLRQEIMGGKIPETVEDTLRGLSSENRDKHLIFDPNEGNGGEFSDN